jgi:hypothetical protein
VQMGLPEPSEGTCVHASSFARSDNRLSTRAGCHVTQPRFRVIPKRSEGPSTSGNAWHAGPVADSRSARSAQDEDGRLGSERRVSVACILRERQPQWLRYDANVRGSVSLPSG